MLGVIAIAGKQYFSDIYAAEDDAPSAQNNALLEGQTFGGKWSDKYTAKITFGKNGTASIVFNDGDKGSGHYAVSRSGKYVIYDHRDKGQFILLRLNSAGSDEGLRFFCAISPLSGWNWEAK